MIEKGFRLRSEAYLSHVRTFPCLVCGASAEAHHLLRTPDGRGMGMKSGDQWCVPLCHPHHMELHDIGAEGLFFAIKERSTRSTGLAPPTPRGRPVMDVRNLALITETATLTQVKKNTLGITAVVRIPQNKVPLDLLAAETGTRFKMSWSSLDDADNVMMTEAVLQGFKRNTSGVAVTVKLHESDVSAKLFMSAAASRWLIAWLRLDDEDAPVAGEVQAAGRNAEMSAKALVQQREFQLWCAREFGTFDDEDGATQAVVESCGVEGLDDISNDHNAVRILGELRAEFIEDWKHS